MLSDFEGAIADYAKAIEINPTDETDYCTNDNKKSDFTEYQNALVKYNHSIKLMYYKK